MRRNTEIELALGVAGAAVERVLAAPALALADGAAEHVRRLVSTYHDAPDHRLIRNNMVWRVRVVGQRRVQTIKLGGPDAAGMYARSEWESEVAGDKPEPPDPNSAVGAMLAKALDGAELTPVFVTDFTRRARPVRAADGAMVELAVDQGEIIAGARRETISEIELELKRGAPGALFDLALAALDAGPLRLLPHSKGERGYRLATGAPWTPTKAAPVALRADMDATEALARMAAACVRQCLLNAPCVTTGAAPVEGVHQMRVALRRLRAVIGLFKDAPAPRAIKVEAQALAAALGAVRDVDVFLAETLPRVEAALPGEPALAKCRRVAALVGAGRLADVVGHIDSERATRLWLMIGRWLATTPSIGAPAPEHAGDVLARRHQKLIRLGRRIKRLDNDALHALRIRVKRQRYAAEFLAPLWGRRDRAERYAAGLRVLQDALGALNDAAVARQVAGDLINRAAPRDRGALARAAGLVIGFHTARASDVGADAATAWRAFARMQPFWDVG